MFNPRTPCCLDPRRRPACGTRFTELKKWVCERTGKGVRIVSLQGDQQGKPPFLAQPVGFDGRSFNIAFDHGCDTEKLSHEACHFFVAPKARRPLINYGLGPGPTRIVDDEEGDNDEATVIFLQRLLAPHFALPFKAISAPDYNVANRRHLHLEECEARAQEIYATLLPSLPPIETK